MNKLKQPNKEILMCDNQIHIITHKTNKNMCTIVKFLQSETDKALKNKKKYPKFSIKKIKELTGINEKQIKNACFILRFTKEPLIRFDSIHRKNSNGVRLTRQISLLKSINKKKENNKPQKEN